MIEYFNIDNWYTTFYGYWGEFPCGRVTLVKNTPSNSLLLEDFLFYVYQCSDVFGNIITYTFDKDFDEIIVDVN